MMYTLTAQTQVCWKDGSGCTTVDDLSFTWIRLSTSEIRIVL